MRPTLGIMITATTYGSWLRGDRRGWIDDGRLMPPCPGLEATDRRRMLHTPFLFSRDQLHDVGGFIGHELSTRLATPIFAFHVGTWHFHLVVGVQPDDVPAVVKCAKDAVRYGLRPGRPIWTDGCDSVTASMKPRCEAAFDTSNVTMRRWGGGRGLGRLLRGMNANCRDLAPGH